MENINNDGASKTTLNEVMYVRLRDALDPLQKSNTVLGTYTGEKNIPTTGQLSNTQDEECTGYTGGGERLTRLDMSQATYQQMTLEEVSRKFITINTHNMLSLQQLRWKAYRTLQHLKTLHRQHSSVHFRNAELLYHCFLPDIATVLQPLHKLLRQGTTWFLKKEQQKAFEEARSDA